MPRDTRYIGLISGIICLILGIVGFFTYSFLTFRDYQFSSEGKSAVGVISNGAASEDSYSITYTFKDSTEHHYSGSANINSEDWNLISVGAQCSITYLPDDPSINRLTSGGDNSKRAALSLLIGILLLLAGGILSRNGIIFVKRINELPKTGIKTEGAVAVEHLENLDTDSSIKKYFALVYSYQDQQNLAHFTFGLKLEECEVEYWRESERLQKGITIYYDPDEPKFHVAQLGPGQYEQGSSSILDNTKLLITSNADISKRARNK